MTENSVMKITLDIKMPFYKRAIFLDRDGVINKVVMRDGKPCSPRKMEEFDILDGAKEAVLKAKMKGFSIIVVTNQPDIARGKMEERELAMMTERIYELLEVDEIFICPHDDHHKCECRKPMPGMLIQAAMSKDIDLERSFLIMFTSLPI